MGLSFFGYANNQSVAASFLKPNREDKNVSPEEMVSYTNQRASQIVGVNGLVRVGGDLTLLKTLLANNFPVIIEKGYDVEDLGWMGHYLLIVGYDDAQAVFFTYDSYLGHGNSQGLRETYADIEFYWKHFNYTFILLYAPERQAEALALLGSRATEQGALEYALATAQAATSVNPSDNWAWFNMGTAFTRLGQYDRAAPAFDQAFALGMPWRTLWYLHDPYLAYYALGRYDDILANAQATENTTPYVEETFYYRAAVLAARGDINAAVRQLDLALTYNSNYQNARILKNALQNASFTPEMVVALASVKGG
jgi:tetratricopeptide (TPR) repeat protein